MNTKEFKRKLTAILSADVEGYSLLMREDEEATIRTLTTYRTAMTGLIQQYRGRVVDSPGDNILAEFTSVVDAVNCAVEIQRELAERNTDLSENRKMQFRIGVNLGDVVEEGDRIYGDGVNIAARLESLAEAGGICISGKVHEEVKNKVGLEYEYLGEQEAKNIAEPVPAYRVLSFPGAAAHRVVKARRAVGKAWRNLVLALVAVFLVGAAVAVWNFYFRRPPVEPASVDRMVFPLPDKPSIAVIPFVNLSKEPEQEYLSDGITENIITALSKTPKMFVIASNSTFTYKGKPTKIQQVAEDLGVRYVLEGSVQRSGDRLRITAQLIDAIEGHHLWAERYDRELEDIFALQDEITMKILSAVEVELTEGEQALSHAKGTDNLEAYLKNLQGRELVRRIKKDANAQARKLLEEAIALDPRYATAYVGLGYTHLLDAKYGWSKSPRKSFEKADKLAQKALSLDDSLDIAHALAGRIFLRKRQYERAISEGEKSIDLGPNNSLNITQLAVTLFYVGKHEKAVRLYEKAIRINPNPPRHYFRGLGYAYRATGRYEDAIATFKKVLQRAPNYRDVQVALASVYSLAGREEEARAEIAEVLKKNPNLCIETVEAKYRRRPYKNKADYQFAIDALRKAGLPETPPLPLPDKPSIAVLPFVNMSGDPEQEYFSDGITEEIITALSKTPKLFVIARTSSFKYKGKEVDVRRVGRELGVRYVLEGSVRKAGDKVRITAQLVDAKTGHHIWAERYDRELRDIFAIQDDITMKIMTAIRVKLTEGEQVRLMGKGTDNIKAYMKVVQGREYLLRFNKQDNILARRIGEEAIALDSDYAAAQNLLGWTHFMDIILGSSKSPRESMARAMELAQKAINMDDSMVPAHSLLGLVYTFTRQYEKGIAECEKAVALGPNNEAAHRFLGLALRYAGRWEEAIPLYERAIRLSPFPKSTTLFGLGVAYLFTGRYEEGVVACKKAVDSEPNSILSHINLTFAYSVSGREEEARTTAAQVLRLDPKFSVDHFAKRALKFKNQSDTERFVAALHKAGLK